MSRSVPLTLVASLLISLSTAHGFAKTSIAVVDTQASPADVPSEIPSNAPTGYVTPGQAFCVSNGMVFVPSNVASVATAGTLQPNQVAVFGFVLPITITISHISIQVSKVAPDSTANAGIYDASRNLLIDSGSFNTAVNTPVQYQMNTLSRR